MMATTNSRRPTRLRLSAWARLAAVLVLAGCPRLVPCGWDEALSAGASYDVELLELYTSESTNAVYTPALGLTRPAETCAALDEI